MTVLNGKEKSATLTLIQDEIQTLVISADKLLEVVLEINGGGEAPREEFYEFLSANDGGVTFKRGEAGWADGEMVNVALKAIQSVMPQLFQTLRIDINYKKWLYEKQ